jgi:hypothetical protein
MSRAIYAKKNRKKFKGRLHGGKPHEFVHENQAIFANALHAQRKKMDDAGVEFLLYRQVTRLAKHFLLHKRVLLPIRSPLIPHFRY